MARVRVYLHLCIRHTCLSKFTLSVFYKFIKEIGLVKQSFRGLGQTHNTEPQSTGVPDYLVANRLGDEVTTLLDTDV